MEAAHPVVKRVPCDPEADILYIVLREGPVEDTLEVDEDVFIEVDERGKQTLNIAKHHPITPASKA